MGKRLDLETWKNIFRNVKETVEESEFVESEWVEVLWLDSTDEWVLCYDTELFEDGFKTEKEAEERLHYLESVIL